MCKKFNTIFILVIVCFCFMFSGCTLNSYDGDYYNVSKISNSEDYYQAKSWDGNEINNGYSISGSEFSGSRTIWGNSFVNDEDIEFNIKLTLAKGKAKIVLIDKDNNFTTLHEVDSNNNFDPYCTCKTIMKIGNNRIKFLGDNCTNFQVELSSDYFLQNKATILNRDVFPQGLFHENSNNWPLRQQGIN